MEPLSIAPVWLLADIRTREKQPEGPILCADVPNRPKQPQRPISTVGARWHSKALPPTELLIENGLGWFTGSRDADCFRLACRLWFQYGDEGTVVAFIYQAWERTRPLVKARSHLTGQFLETLLQILEVHTRGQRDLGPSFLIHGLGKHRYLRRVRQVEHQDDRALSIFSKGI